MARASTSRISEPSMLALTSGDSPCSKELLERVIRDWERVESFTSTNIAFERAVDPGDNYVAHVYRAILEGKTLRNGVEKAIRKTLLVKRPILDNANIPPGLFHFEQIAYDHVIRQMEMTLQQRLPIIRRLYADSDTVITEDFQARGYVLSNRRDGLNDAQCEVVARSLGKLHAATILGARYDDWEQETTFGLIQDPIFSPVNESVCRKTLADAFEIAHYFLEKYKARTPYPKRLLEITEFMKINSNTLYNSAKEEINFMNNPEYKVIVHGSCWANNFMFKEDGSSEYALLINLPTMCLSNPIRDLVYIFATNPYPINEMRVLTAYIKKFRQIITEHGNILCTTMKSYFSIYRFFEELLRVKQFSLMIAIWLLLPMSYVTFPTMVEYNATGRLKKPELVERHIDVEFYTRRLLEIIDKYLIASIDNIY